MKECPKCKELLGENVDRCFKCGYSFGPKKPGESSKKENRICPKCKKVYYSVSYTECPNCHISMPLYSLEAKKLAEAENARMENLDIASSFGLNDLDSIDANSIRQIAAHLSGNGILNITSIIGGTKPENMVMMSCLRALVEQNWILIRQLNKVNKQLEEVVKAVNTKPPQEI